MKILAIDTSTEACSAALYIDGVITEDYQLAPREHTKLILRKIESLLDHANLKIADLDALAFGRGPGSFAGVRIATSITQGLAFACELPVLPISTLASIAQYTYDTHQHAYVFSGIDARMGEMYWGCYQLGENGLMQLVSQEQVTSAERVNVDLSLSQVWNGAGSAWQAYAGQLNEVLGDQIGQYYSGYFPHAASIVKLAAEDFKQNKAVGASQALPVYLRNDVAKKKSEQQKQK